MSQIGTEDRGQAKFHINLGVAESQGGLSGRLDYDAGLFRRETMTFLGQCLKTFLKQAAADATRPLSKLSLLSEEWWCEVADIQARQPRRAVAHRSFGEAEVSLLERFLTQVERYPHHLTVVAPAQRRTYRQLDERARQLATALLAYGNLAEAHAKAQRLWELVPDRTDLVTPITEKLIEQGWLDEGRARSVLRGSCADAPLEIKRADLDSEPGAGILKRLKATGKLIPDGDQRCQQQSLFDDNE